MKITNMDIIAQLKKTSLSKSIKSNDMLNNIVYNSFHDADTDEQEIAIAAIAYKYNLSCLDELLGVLEVRGAKLPF
jgi:hypothetical protein